jgi:hypothetical protein
MKREEVLEIVSDERDYQESLARGNDRPDVVPHQTLGDHLLAMEELIAQARRAWYSGSKPHTAAMDLVRKATAMGVKAGEQIGMPRRAR